MQIFISWSGERSRRLALVLQSWIPQVIQSIRGKDIWVSDRDIEPGQQWARVLGDALDKTRIGLLCLTPENRRAPWIHFEAGALAKHLDQAKVIPVLYGIHPEDIQEGPLAQFQGVQLAKSDISKMLQSLNSEMGRNKLADDILASSLEHTWPELETQLQEIEQIRIDDMEGTLPGVIGAFSNRGLAEPHPGRIVHFEEGFESHTLYNVLTEIASRRLLIFGRKNRKLFDKEHRDFLDSLPQRIANGFDFRCLFLSPDAPDAVLKVAHADDDFKEQLRASVKTAQVALEQRNLSPEKHFRFYTTLRTVNVIIVDDAVLFTPIEVAANGRAKPLTKCSFSVVDSRHSLGQRYLKTFDEAWDAATPMQ